jgi:NAD(P)-dependent dehydrogenase (short-subunit alcohol dehydrogenase family)
MASLAGQAAIITGAGTGIGRAIALTFAREGAAVTLVGRRRELLAQVAAEIATAGGLADIAPADVTRAEQVVTPARSAIERWGRVDILVNSAGANVPRRALAELAAEDLRLVVEANLVAPFLMTQAVLPSMRAARRGTIIAISSMAGVRASLLSGPAYSAAKAGLNSFVDSINLAERRYGIRACAICPGEVDTPLLEQRPIVPPPEARATMLQPDDVAAAALLVATLPDRATVELIVLRPTLLRDTTAEVRAPERR